MVLALGIDPGVKGAAATSDGWVMDLPVLGPPRKRRLDSAALLAALRERRIDVAAIELPYVPRPETQEVACSEPECTGRISVKTITMGLAGISSSWTIYGQCVAVLQMLQQENGLRWEDLQPYSWKKQLGLSRSKDASHLLATQLYGPENLRGPRGGKRYDRAEALLLAELALRRSGRTVPSPGLRRSQQRRLA